MKINKFFLLIFLASIFGLYATVIAQVETGSIAPDFKLSDSNGKIHTLADYKGKHVVLEWTNHLCPFVKKYYDHGDMQAIQKKFTKKDVVWLSIISSAPEKQGHVNNDEANKLINDRNCSPTAVLLDSSGTVGKKYRAKTTPHMYLINPDGILVYQGAIDSIRSVDTSDIANADNYIVSALTESMQGKIVSISNTTPYGCSVKY